MECRNQEDSSEELANCSNQLFVLAKPRPKCTIAVLQTQALRARIFENGCLFGVEMGEDIGEVLAETKMPVKLVAPLRRGLAVDLIQNLQMTVNHQMVLLKVSAR